VKRNDLGREVGADLGQQAAFVSAVLYTSALVPAKALALVHP